ncbi:hypothetical protein AB0I60_19735 [Actinosynnema sp. NPDC050436]|uniref:hypothetical protein n=1 Tax=Actinosynnema sp. NPDC050436 TaxID=3155659 RepID=UPI0033F25690
MRLKTLPVAAALLVTSLAAPAPVAAAAAADPPAPGWTSTGTELVWTAPRPVPAGGAAVEFWDGDRLLGRPLPSADLRSYALASPGVRSTEGLQVRAAGRRLDAEEPARVTAAPPPAPAPGPAAAVDPGTPGPFPTRTGEYALDPITVPGYAAPIEVQAVVVAPEGLPGPRPLALFLHGRHFTCYDPATPDSVLLVWPCPAGTRAVPSHRGYLQAQRLLASQGYVTVSVSANGVNAQDAQDPEAGAGARSALVRTHLAKWADWAGTGRPTAPDAVRAAPVADLANVVLVGHSRGGEGVNRAATDSLTPPPPGSGHDGPARWTIKGDLLIGPTLFGHNPAPDVPSATILPGCDGDVSDLQGQLYLDATRGLGRGTALHSALYFVGANHNYFNTEWTPGQAEAPADDDFSTPPADPVCSPGTGTRLTPVQQQTAGATYVAAAARLFVAGDQRVLPLLDGSGARAPSADPARVLSHAVGGARSAFVVPDQATVAEGAARVCLQVTKDAAAACVDPAEWRASPHFTRFNGIEPEPDRHAVALSWSQAGQVARVRPGREVSLAGARALALRLIVPPNSTGTRFDVAVTDAGGHRAVLGAVALDGLPATSRMSARWAQEVRVPLSAHGVDLHRVTALELVPHGASGTAWLVDAHGWDHGLPDPGAGPLPRVDVGVVTVAEGDSGTRTYQVPVTVTGDGPGSFRLFAYDDARRSFTQRLVTLEPGGHVVRTPMEVTGNTRWSPDSQRPLLVKAVRGTVAGRYAGGLAVREDDPRPTITVTPVADRVAEGGVLTWRATLSAPADVGIGLVGAPVVPPGGPELSTTDVDGQWFRRQSHQEDPLPSRPLSTTGLQVQVYFPPGEVTSEFTVPTAADTEAEPAEAVRLLLTAWPPGSPDLVVTGTVTDPAG